MCNFVCGTMSYAKLLYWSVIHYQMTFERYSGLAKEININLTHMLIQKTFCFCFLS